MSDFPPELDHGDYDTDIPGADQLEPDYEAEEFDEVEEDVVPLDAEDLSNAASSEEAE